MVRRFLVLVTVLSACATTSALRTALTRRAAVLGAAAASSTVYRGAALAGDIEDEDEESIRRRAKEDQLTEERAISRAKSNTLVSGEGFDCFELQRLIDVDRAALKKEELKLLKMKTYVGKLVSDEAEEALQKKMLKAKAETMIIRDRLDGQVARLQAEQFSRSVCTGGTL